jgi:hypothetical protein
MRSLIWHQCPAVSNIFLRKDFWKTLYSSFEQFCVRALHAHNFIMEFKFVVIVLVQPI